MRKSIPGSELLELVPSKRISPKHLQDETILGIVDRLFGPSIGSNVSQPGSSINASLNSDMDTETMRRSKEITILKALQETDISIATGSA